MRVFVNAIAAKDAGARSVVVNFLKAIQHTSPRHTFDVFVPPLCGYDVLETSRIRIHTLPQYWARRSFRPVVDRYLLPRAVARLQADVVFSMGNIAIPVRGKPQLLLFHWAYAIYPDSIVWCLMNLRSRASRRLRLRAFQRALPYATQVAAQTHTAKRRLEQIYGLSNVCVIPNAVSLPNFSDTHVDALQYVERKSPRVRLLLCLTRYYPHKNLEILLQLGRIIKSHGAPYRVITTVSADQDPGAARFLSSIQEAELRDVIHNIGPVPMDQVPSLYQSVDGLLLPTLLESFSGTYVEAMYYGVPVLTSDMDFARDVCGDAAFYFDPLNAESIYKTVVEAFASEGETRRRVEMGRNIVRSFPDWVATAGMYIETLERLVRQHRGREKVDSLATR